MVAGITITILAAIVQATDITLTIIWQFDHNGIFHLLQIPGVLLIFKGLKVSVQKT